MSSQLLAEVFHVALNNQVSQLDCLILDRRPARSSVERPLKSLKCAVAVLACMPGDNEVLLSYMRDCETLRHSVKAFAMSATAVKPLV